MWADQNFRISWSRISRWVVFCSLDSCTTPPSPPPPKKQSVPIICKEKDERIIMDLKQTLENTNTNKGRGYYFRDFKNPLAEHQIFMFFLRIICKYVLNTRKTCILVSIVTCIVSKISCQVCRYQLGWYQVYQHNYTFVSQVGRCLLVLI